MIQTIIIAMVFKYGGAMGNILIMYKISPNITKKMSSVINICII